MKLDPTIIKQQVQFALTEDIGNGDLTAGLLDPTQESNAEVITREAGILCGTQWFEQCFLQLNDKVKIQWQAHDGDKIVENQVLCTINGLTHVLLSAERTALNFLQTLSATASTTHQYVTALAGTPVKILDTRKTIPGLRLAQKYAVACGGGMNHRIGLYDMILIKENHIRSCGSIAAAIQKAQENNPHNGTKVEIEIEVESIDELKQALAAGTKHVLLDNFSRKDLLKAVSINQQQATLEVSGNITLDNLPFIAQTGIDYISSGAITKNIRALDLSMRLTEG